MVTEEIIFPQDINLQLTVKVSAEGGIACVIIPTELRLTERVYLLIQQLLEAQGLKLGNMNISPEHVEEVKGLPNILLKDKNLENK